MDYTRTQTEYSVSSPRIDVGSLREALAGNQGPEYWQSLEQLAGTPEFQDYLDHEFPHGADEEMDAVTRRHFLKIMGASFALAGLGACVKQPDEKIIPYVKAPEEFIPGRPLYFATAHVRSGYATGVLVESHMGRPTKVEGNPDHPASLGGTDLFAQASVLGLYDPDRSKTVIDRGEISSWSSFLVALTRELDKQRPKKGAGMRILTETVTSPTLAEQLRRVREAYPAATWHQFDPLARDSAHLGSRIALGRSADAVYHFDKADVVVTLDADVLGSMTGSVRYSRDLIGRRNVNDKSVLSRLYVIESTPSITGAMADHRIALRSSDVEAFTRALAASFGGESGGGGNATLPDAASAMATSIAADLKAHGSRAVVVAGDTQPPVVHALAHQINSALGSVGGAVAYGPNAEAEPVDHNASLRSLVEAMNAGAVEMLIVLGGNPVYTAPADLNMAEAMNRVPFRVHNSLYDDETSRVSHWHVPATHFLEMWSDARSFDGTVTILQPLIAPLYVGKSPHEILAALVNESGKSVYEIVRLYWHSIMRSVGYGGDFEAMWRSALNDGVVADGPSIPSRAVNSIPSSEGEVRFDDSLSFIQIEPPSTPSAAPGITPDTAASRNQPPLATPPPATNDAGDLEIVFRPDPTIWDGSYVNNGWLQELPNPLTKLTWDNAAYVSVATAERLALATGDVVALTYRGRTVNAPIMIAPGHVDDSVTVTLGYGRKRAGRIGSELGYNAYALRTSDAPWFGRGLALSKTGERYPLATTQHHFTVDGRDLVRSGTVEELRTNPSLAPSDYHALGHTSMYPEYKYEGYAWGMAIDIDKCTGCTACVIACVAENNIPIVGKQQVLGGREMHWLRVDTYFKGDIDNPATVFQPIPCMQCEVAPCEVVCPVNATVHSHEGLNDMVYNRCIGTRYCSNNCPYKVRRFNFLHFTENVSETEALGKNPDVTVRSRGVMEKCTYCVQRINHARIDAKRDDRKINDGEIETACQGACPTGAIVFGDINDKASRVSVLKAEQRNYPLLPELNTKPRTTYLGRVRNPNPALA
ncbi:MAG: TAT-variant-translocated molybdopterin oxidoreductase [bacterium]|nr:TAT-variant-translocated molybdopterin oxidoreductase [Candidatus Kapabacteria bacterium]